MDAAEADADVKLYKASSELLLELRAKVPRLVQVHGSQSKYRKWVIATKVYEVTYLLDSFQEWPQLLDPHLASLIQVLVDAYISYCVLHSREYIRSHNLRDQLLPLPRAVADVLYAFCKVRGYKVIVRLLNNEPRYIEPLLSCFRLWSSRDETVVGKGVNMTWSERYVHLLWLSHLMLAPFELSTISGLAIKLDNKQKISEFFVGLPDVSINLAMAGLDHLHVSSKARDAASILSVRLSLRSDMQKLGLPEKLVAWTVSELQSPLPEQQSVGYHYIGLLQLLFGIINLSSDSEAAPLLSKAFGVANLIATSSSQHCETIRDTAPARRLLIKIMRSTVVHALAIDGNPAFSGIKLDLNTMLEDCIQVLLDFLADKDTPVRQAASKALSLICLNLDSQMSSDIVEAVVDSLNENMFLEDIKDGKLFPATDVAKGMSAQYKKNLNAVDPLKWHGCMLTLGHLLFRRSLPVFQLPSVIEALLMGLDFQQRSNVGTSIGVGVRDAACFGIWSLARKYSTAELNQSSVSSKLIPHPDGFAGITKTSTLQLVATHLAMSACLDPSGNLRRGSSAALQELIGRHPDVIAEGIPVVQVIDYHAVARRSNALIEVAVSASKLDSHYHGSLLYALLGWRGARATDADSRRQTARAVELLRSMTPWKESTDFLREILQQVGNLKTSNSGMNAAARHGLFRCLASTFDSLFNVASTEQLSEVLTITQPAFQNLNSVIGTIEGRISTDTENVLEGTTKIISAYAELLGDALRRDQGLLGATDASQWAESVLPILDRCTVSSDTDNVTEAAALASIGVLKLLSVESQTKLISLWLDPKQQSKASFVCKGRISTLALVVGYSCTSDAAPSLTQFRQPIFGYSTRLVSTAHTIETRVNAMSCIGVILGTASELKEDDLRLLASTIHTGLTDYTMDQRGDIGSLLRLESIRSAERLGQRDINSDTRLQTMQLLARLAAEKLVKVRFQACKCLKDYLPHQQTTLSLSFAHQADVSSFEYFRSLLELLHQPDLRDRLLTGVISTVSGGTDEASLACSEALITFVQDQNFAEQSAMIDSITEVASRQLAANASRDDHEAVPVIDFLAFIVEHIIAHQTDSRDHTRVEQIWNSCQKAHTATSSIIRLEAMVRLYSALAILDSCRPRALEKLTRLLLHRWPKIRGTAADAIFLQCTAQSLIPLDWNASVADNKSAVLALRKELNVAGSSAISSASRPAAAT